MWGKGETYSQLVGVQIGAALRKISVGSPQNLETGYGMTWLCHAGADSKCTLVHAVRAID